MKLGMIGLVGVGMGAVLSIGCGPGLGHHGKWANAPGAEVGSATLSSESMPLPASRMSLRSVGPVTEWLDRWEDDGPSEGAPQTWGTPPKPEDKYGF